MKKYSRTPHCFTYGIRGLLLALICAAALFVSGCSKDGDTINQVATPTTGTLKDATGSATVVIDKTVSIALVLKALPIVANAPPYVYRDGSGNLIPVTAGQFSSGQFVFYAWLQDLPLGIVPANLTTATVTDPHQPLLTVLPRGSASRTPLGLSTP